MAKEIERKFLVDGTTYRDLSCSRVVISQGYLCRDPERTARVRIFGERACLTVKSASVGPVRDEWEYSIPVDDAARMMTLCTGRIIRKTRYIVDAGDGLRWEVDEFDGDLAPLVLAEIELPSASYPLPTLPGFIGREVTGEPRYFNSALAAGD